MEMEGVFSKTQQLVLTTFQSLDKPSTVDWYSAFTVMSIFFSSCSFISGELIKVDCLACSS